MHVEADEDWNGQTERPLKHVCWHRLRWVVRGPCATFNMAPVHARQVPGALRIESGCDLEAGGGCNERSPSKCRFWRWGWPNNQKRSAGKRKCGADEITMVVLACSPTLSQSPA